MPSSLATGAPRASPASAVRDATAAARDGHSPFLRDRLAENDKLTARDVIEAADHGDGTTAGRLDLTEAS